MEDQMPITKSLHRLCVENPRFLVHPLLWSPKHLQVLHCRSDHLDTAALPPSTPLLPSNNLDPDNKEHYMKQILGGRFAAGKFASFDLLTEAHGVVGRSAEPSLNLPLM